jgi:hypothetical protein
MSALAVDSILFVHGYSVRNLSDYAALPGLLARTEGIPPPNIILAAFVSLDDQISCDDLAYALDRQIAALEKAKRIDLRRTAIISHSTGSIITRRWMLNRLASGGPLPSHFISCAGANHGSTLAQLGRTAMAYIFRELTEGTSVGQRVLDDLDYGSAFLRKLNSEWFAAWNAGRLDPAFCFSIIGTDHSFWRNQLDWHSRENGSDGTVRISGSNLNYRYIEVAPAAPGAGPAATPYAFKTSLMGRRAAHLIVEHLADASVAGDPEFRYSHTSDQARDVEGLVMSGAASVVDKVFDKSGGEQRVSSAVSGIIEGIQSAGEPAYVALKRALSIANAPDYDALATEWAARNEAWSAANVAQTCSTVVMTIKDLAGRPVLHYLTLLRDNNGNAHSVSLSLEDNQPIPNQEDPSTLSMYVNYATWSQVHPHSVRIQLYSDTPYVCYGLPASPNVIDGDLSGEDDPANPQHVIAPNECTYINITIERDPSSALAFYREDDPVVRTAPPFPPFPAPTLAVM